MYLLVTTSVSYKFFDKETGILTLSGFKQLLLGVAMFPEVLNNLSDAALLAHM